MLSFLGGLKGFVALEPVDFRNSFSGLEGLVSARPGEDLRQGALFVFTNRWHSPRSLRDITQPPFVRSGRRRR